MPGSQLVASAWPVRQPHLVVEQGAHPLGTWALARPIPPLERGLYV